MKEEILHTALAGFLKHGIREMSIQKLIAPLGISTKTVYKYFNDKEELLEAALLLYYAQQYEQLQKGTAMQNPVHLLLEVWTKAVEQAFRANNIFFRDLNYYYPQLEIKIERSIAEKFAGELLGIIKKGVKEGYFRKDILPGVVLESIFVLYKAIARGDQFKRFKIAPADILHNTIAVFIRGFCTEKGMQKLDGYHKEQKVTKSKKLRETKVNAFNSLG